MYARAVISSSRNVFFDLTVRKNAVACNSMFSGLAPELMASINGGMGEMALAVLQQLCKLEGSQAMWWWCRSVHAVALTLICLSCLPLLN